MEKQTDLPILQKTYDLIKWFIPKIELFPRTQKFVLGDRIEVALLEFLRYLTLASKRRNKVEILETADAKLFEVRYLIRLATTIRRTATTATDFVVPALATYSGPAVSWNHRGINSPNLFLPARANIKREGQMVGNEVCPTHSQPCTIKL